jgi:hypothetical protein
MVVAQFALPLPWLFITKASGFDGAVRTTQQENA